MPSDPQPSRARKQLRTRDAIPLDEVESDFGMKGMLSFLQVPREEASRNLEARRAVDLARNKPIGDIPSSSGSQVVDITSRSSAHTPGDPSEEPMGDSLEADTLNNSKHEAIDVPLLTTPERIPNRVSKSPQASSSTTQFGRPQPSIGDFHYSVHVPDVGRRKPFRWTLAQDAHTAAEQNLFAAMMELARKQGRKLPDGSSLVEASLTDLQRRLRTDHKQVKKLLASLIEKHAIALDRSADQARQQPTRYRIFTFQQINETRRSLGLLWVVKNRGVRLLSEEFVRHLQSESPMGFLPMGDSDTSEERPMGNVPTQPMGHSVKSPMGRSPEHLLIEEDSLRNEKKSTSSSAFVDRLRQLFDGDCDVKLAEMIWHQGKEAAPDVTEDEVLHFATTIYQKAKHNPRVYRPQSIVVTTIAGHIRDGGLQILRDHLGRHDPETKRDEDEQTKRDQQDAIEFWKGIANDPAESHHSRVQARSILQDYGIIVDG
jgi:hypothetical protein